MPAPAIETILRVDENRAWIRLLDQAASEEETRLGKHAVQHFFKYGTENGMAFYHSCAEYPFQATALGGDG